MRIYRVSETVLSMSVSLIHPVYLVLHTGCRKRKRDREREDGIITEFS